MLASPEIRRLLTLPGVNVVTAARCMAAIGDIRRFQPPRQLVGYLGLDPRVRQSGAAPAATAGSASRAPALTRHVLVEAAWSRRAPAGPLRAFYERIRARRGHQVATVAVARKLACLFWCLLSRGEDYAYGRPSLTREKIRQLELRAGAKTHKGIRRNLGNEAAACARQSASWRPRPRPPTGARSPTGNERRKERARARHRGAHLVGRQAAKQRGRSKPLGLLFSSSSEPAPEPNSPKLEVLRPERT